MTGPEYCHIFPRGYLPMGCPNCGRVRVEYGINKEGGVVYMRCEKCGVDDFFPPGDEPTKP